MSLMRWFRDAIITWILNVYSGCLLHPPGRLSRYRDLVLGGYLSIYGTVWSPSFLHEPRSRPLAPPFLPLGREFHVSATLFARYYEFRNIIILATCFHDIEFRARSPQRPAWGAVEYLTFLPLCVRRAIPRATSVSRYRCRELHGCFHGALCVGIYPDCHRLVRRNNLKEPAEFSEFFSREAEKLCKIFSVEKRCSKFLNKHKFPVCYS